MMKSFWKTIPALALALSVGGFAQQPETALQELAVKDRTVGRTRNGAVPCGIVEGNQCYARGCSASMGGAFEFEFLYWRAENHGFIPAWHVTNAVEQLDATGNYQTGAKLVRPEGEWNPGFRLGMGWNTTHDRWDLFFDWTWYKNHTTLGTVSVSNASANGIGLYPFNNGVLTARPLVGPYNTLTSSWKLWNNCFDMELGRAYYLTKQLSLRNHWGLRGAVLKQKHVANFSTPGQAAPGNLATPLNAESIREGNKFWGVGPRAGVQTKYHVGKGFSVVGKGAVALLFGQEKWKHRDYTFTATNPKAAASKNTGMHQTLAPNLQLFFGAEWATCFSCDEIFFGMQAGWEANVWWNQYAITTMPGNKATNDALTMEGLTVSFHIDY